MGFAITVCALLGGAAFSQMCWPPGEIDEHGWAVAALEDRLLVSSPGDDDACLDCGSVCSWIWDVDVDTWVEEAQILPPVPMHRFGSAIALGPDIAFVCAETGSPYVFRFDGIGWVEEQELTSFDSDSVAVSDNVALVGDQDRDGFGAAYVFRFDGETWVLEQTLTAADPQAGDQFGRSVSVSGDGIAVGANGSAYVFRYDGGAQSWSQENEIIPSGGSGGFGRAVAIEGDVVAVGAPGSNVVHVYRFNTLSLVWDEDAVFSDADSNGWFGHSVALFENTLLAGAPAAGQALYYDYDGNAWSLVKVLPSKKYPWIDFDFGWSVSMWYDLAFIGYPGWPEPDQFMLGGGDGTSFAASLVDCNGNGAPDAIDVLLGGYPDINSNWIPDECDDDCNNNGVLDDFDVDPGDPDGNRMVSDDCNDNLVPDECELDSSMPPDGIIDACDCNDNGALDADDIDPADPDGDGEVSEDYNLDGLPDECQTTFAGDAIWMNVFGGEFRSFMNWDPDTPRIDNRAIFDLIAPGPYTVTFDQDIDNERLLVTTGDITFDLGGNAYQLAAVLDPGVVVGEVAGDDGRLTITNGSVFCDVARIGADSGAVGEVMVSGLGAAWMIDNELCIGCLGTGDMTIEAGGLVDTVEATVGQEIGSFGHVLVTGPGSQWMIPVILFLDNGEVEVADGGEVKVPLVGVVVSTGGLLTGDGIISGDVFNAGFVAPAARGGESLLVVGDYEQSSILAGNATGWLQIGIGDPGTGEHGRLQVSGTASVAGGLRVELAGTEPGIGQSFDVVSATTLEGAFDVAFMPGLSGGNFMRVLYGPGLGPNTTTTVVVENLESLFGFDENNPIDVVGEATAVAVGDLDGDSDEDIAITLKGAAPELLGSVLVLRNGGFDTSGQWMTEGGATQTPVGLEPSGIVIDFLDGDAHRDIAVTNLGDDTVQVLGNTGAGDATFSTLATIGVGDEPTDLAAADFDLNGDVDLVVSNGADATMEFLFNVGDGTFGSPIIVGAGLKTQAVDTGDLDNDKDEDAFSVNEDDDTITVAFNDGNGAFSTPMTITLPVGDAPVDLAVSDLDNSGYLDLVTANNGDGTVSVVLNNGGGSFVAAVNLPVGELPTSLTTLDLEGGQEMFPDSDLAVVTNNAEGDRVVKILRNDLTGGQLIFADATELAEGEDPVLVTAGDLDSDGQDDLITINELVVPGPVEMSSVKVRANLSDCPQDLDNSGDIGVTDLLEVLGAWGSDPGGPPDFDSDGNVGVTDLLAVLGAWGSCL